MGVNEGVMLPVAVSVGVMLPVAVREGVMLPVEVVDGVMLPVMEDVAVRLPDIVLVAVGRDDAKLLGDAVLVAVCVIDGEAVPELVAVNDADAPRLWVTVALDVAERVGVVVPEPDADTDCEADAVCEADEVRVPELVPDIVPVCVLDCVPWGDNDGAALGVVLGVGCTGHAPTLCTRMTTSEALQPARLVAHDAALEGKVTVAEASATVTVDGKLSGPPPIHTSAGPSMHTWPKWSTAPVVTIPSTPAAMAVAPAHGAPLASTTVTTVHAVRMLRSAEQR